MINQVVNSTLCKYHIDNIPVVKELLELNKKIIKNKVIEYQKKFPKNKIILIGTSAMQLHGLLYKPIKDIDLALIQGELPKEKISRIDILDWRVCGYTIDGWKDRIVTIDGIEVLSIRDLLVTFSMNLHRPNKVDAITLITKYNNNLKEQALLDIKEFRAFSKKLGEDNPKTKTFLESMDKFDYIVSNNVIEHELLEDVFSLDELKNLNIDKKFKEMIFLSYE